MRRVLLVALFLCAACGAKRPGDEIIAQAQSPEEQKKLIERRDQLESEIKQQLAEKEAEIARLEKENADLKEKLGGK